MRYRIALNDTDVYFYDSPIECGEGLARLLYSIDESDILTVERTTDDEDEESGE